jgi:hypothetical protein
MSGDPKEHIRAGRRAMNLLTKRGKWGAAPISSKLPRLVSFAAGPFAVIGQQGGSRGGGVVFELSYNGELCLQGLARINWLTEDTSFELDISEMSSAAREELAALYSELLPDSFKV